MSTQHGTTPEACRRRRSRGRLGARLRAGGFATVAMSLLVLIVLGTVAYATVMTPSDPWGARQLLKAGRVRITNNHGGKALVGMKDMMPGDRTSGTVVIGNASRRSKARLYLGLSKLVEKQGPAGGRLSYRLVLSVKRIWKNHRPQVVYAGPLRRMPLLKLGKFRRHEKRTYKFTVRFPDGPPSLDNRFQSSGVSLQFTWYARKAR